MSARLAVAGVALGAAVLMVPAQSASAAGNAAPVLATGCVVVGHPSARTVALWDRVAPNGQGVSVEIQLDARGFALCYDLYSSESAE